MESFRILCVLFIALCVGPLSVNAGSFCYFEQIPGGLAQDPTCLSDGPSQDTANMKFRLWNPATNKYLAYTGSKVQAIALDKKSNFNWQVLPGKDGNSVYLKQSTGRKYIASPISKPPSCFNTLLIKSISIAALDLQCNDPNDVSRQGSRQGGPDWAGQCEVSALNFDAGLIAVSNSKNAQWCSAGANQPVDNFTWKFVKVN